MDFLTLKQARILVASAVEKSKKKHFDIVEHHTFIDMKLSEANAELGMITMGLWIDCKNEYLRLAGGNIRKFHIRNQDDSASFCKFADWGFGKTGIFEEISDSMVYPPMIFGSYKEAREWISEFKDKFSGCLIKPFEGVALYGESY